MNKFIWSLFGLTSIILLCVEIDAICPINDPVEYCQQFYNTLGANPNANCSNGDVDCFGGLVCINDGPTWNRSYCECPIYRDIQSQIGSNPDANICDSPLLNYHNGCWLVLQVNYKKLIQPLWWIFYLIGVCIALPLLIIERNKKDSSRIDAWFLGGCFVLATLPLSMTGIVSHALNYQKPYLQKHIIRILFMVPIYALNSWFVLRFPKAAIYLDTFRECYEAFVIYNFLIYLCNYLEYDVEDFRETFESKTNINLIFPFCFLPNCSNGLIVLRRCKFGVLQFVINRLLTTCVAFICQLCNVYKEGDINFKYAWPYIAIINNFSQMVAMYCLVLFYTLCRQELKPLNPIAQFLCIKFVVFVTFWQGLLIAVLVKAGVISTDQWPYYPTIVETANGLQDFIICIEMFVAAIAHLIAFNTKPYRVEARENYWWQNLLNAANVSDLHTDVVQHCKQITTTVGSLTNSFAGSFYKVSSSQDRVTNVNETSRLLDNESFNSYSYASTFKSNVNVETVSNFSNTKISNTDQSSMLNYYPSSYKSIEQCPPNTSEKLIKNELNTTQEIQDENEIIA